MNPDYGKFWPRVSIDYKGTLYGPGQSFEVHSENDLGIIGAEPAARKYFRIDLKTGDHLQHNVSDGGRWKLDVELEVADAAVADAADEIDPNELEEEAPAKKHHGRKKKG